MPTERHQQIRALFDDYIARYAARDDRLTSLFSDNFSGYTGSGDTLVKSRAEWVRITRQDFAQVPGQLRIEMLDLALQDLADDVVVATAFFHIHLPQPEHILSRQTARLVLIFRREDGAWKIAHSGISVPYYAARSGEIYPIDDLQQRNRELAALVEERTEALQTAKDKLEALSNTDGLTCIANRRSFDVGLAREWKRAQRNGSALALLLIDVDRFKHYNDHYGHLAGDDCLRALGKVLAQTGRRSIDLVARYGGEEFVAMLPGTTLADALERAREIQRQTRALAIAHAGTPAAVVTVSIGVAALTPTRQQRADDLLRGADQALYQAKRAGRNRVCAAPDPTEQSKSG